MEHYLTQCEKGDTLDIEDIDGELTVVGRDGSGVVVEAEDTHEHDCSLYSLHKKSDVETEADARQTLVMPMYQEEAEAKGFL